MPNAAPGKEVLMSNSKKGTKNAHLLNLKLISGTILFLLFLTCVGIVFYFTAHGGSEVLATLT